MHIDQLHEQAYIRQYRSGAFYGYAAESSAAPLSIPDVRQELKEQSRRRMFLKEGSILHTSSTPRQSLKWVV